MSAVTEEISEDILTKALLKRQSYTNEMLGVLRQHFARKGGHHGVFAPIKGACCGACRMTIASARLQRAKTGVFITCGNCSRFLYLPETVMAENNTPESE
ncbi:MAG TPA: hypothetical protein VFD58_16830 [Blastocatellia bacterium]|nr:hypothetical protein [Blastocatellia bacterium]